ncbi:MAG: segregation/condensation protein A [Deltaproteobacteria bacterium]|nr:segregation/condensation protein A [Deltaproteobacteria bacterium]
MQPAEDQKYTVKLDVFEGPLDLLLHLIRKHELDIFDIPIAFITSKYVEYIDRMKELNLDLAAEYLDMAATLVLIKSRMLLPTPPEEAIEDMDPGPDPREELVRRLLEYQKYKTAAEQIAALPQLGRDTFPRGAAEAVSVDQELQAPGLFALLDAFQDALRRAKIDPTQEISVTRISVSARIIELLDVLRRRPNATFAELFDTEASRSELVVTFLALLEMTRLKLTRLHQAGTHGDIHVVAAASPEEAERVLAAQRMED